MWNASPKPAIVTPPIEPTTALQRSKKLLDPLVFTSKRQKLQSFLNWLRNKLTSNADYYPTKAN